MSKLVPVGWRKASPQRFLLLSTLIVSFTFAGWHTLLNNFAIEVVHFSGREIGLLQSIREIPGFLAFTAVFLLLWISEQRLAIVSLVLLCIGVGTTGLFASPGGFYLTTLLMSIGFHYFETVNNSLTLQWNKKAETAAFMGRQISIKAMASLLAFVLIYVLFEFQLADFKSAYLLLGIGGGVLLIGLGLSHPQFEQAHLQHKKLIFRKRYWLFYCLTFLSGARRQIFMVFAGFMMVEKFAYDAADIALLFMINHAVNFFLAPKIGRLIARIGERRALTIEYVGLALVFTGYAIVNDATFAAVLYVIDHLFFAMAIAIKTFFQKIADPKDIAASSGVSFTINHIAAVVIPALFGLLWLINPAMVFLAGAAIALTSLVLAQQVDRQLAIAKAYLSSR